MKRTKVFTFFIVGKLLLYLLILLFGIRFEVVKVQKNLKTLRIKIIKIGVFFHLSQEHIENIIQPSIPLSN